VNLKRVLRSVVFFEYLTDSHIQQLVDMAGALTVKVGEILFSEGEAENHLYLIEDGRIQISRDGRHFGRQTFALLGPGDHFGALSLFYPDPHFATATAVRPTRLWILRHDHFQARLREDRELAFAVLKGMALGIRAANCEIRRLTTLLDRRSRLIIELSPRPLAASPSGPPPPAG